MRSDCANDTMENSDEVAMKFQQEAKEKLDSGFYARASHQSPLRNMIKLSIYPLEIKSIMKHLSEDRDSVRAQRIASGRIWISRPRLHAQHG